MALLDFVKHRTQKQQPVAETPQQKPETAKQMYTREAANEQRKPVEQMPDAEKQKAVDAARPAAKLMEKATHHRSQSHAQPEGHSDTREALMHNQNGQQKSQEAMSPTDSGKSHKPEQNRSRGMER